MSIANLKRASTSQLKQVQANAKADTSKRSYADERYWSPIVDKNNNGSAIIRFLPGIIITDATKETYDSPYVQSLLRTGYVEGEKLQYEPSYVRKWSHGFKGPTGLWYIENNRNTLGTKEDPVDDPCTDYNAALWKTKDAEMVQQARDQKRKLLYVSNIQVIKHVARPEDEGQSFLFAYGKKVFDKIDAAINPDPEDGVEPLDVFNFWKGANFHLRIRNVDSFRNYDMSSFQAPKPLHDDDDMLEAIFNKQHSLLDEVGTDKFKSYEDLETHLHRVLNLKGDGVDQPPAEQARTIPTATRVSAPVTEAEQPPFDVDDDGVVTESTSTDAKSFFKTLAIKKA